MRKQEEASYAKCAWAKKVLNILGLHCTHSPNYVAIMPSCINFASIS